jgi:hypothetical protein
MATEMATRLRQPTKAQRAPSPSRRSRAARGRAVKRLPDGVTDNFDGDRPVPGLGGLSEADAATESAQGVVLTRDAVANAVRSLIALAARWDGDKEFSRTSSPALRRHMSKALEDVVSILQIAERSAPIAKADKYRITRDDANLLTVFHAVEAAIADYAKRPGDDVVPPFLTWLLGNTYRVPAQKLAREWATHVRRAATDAAGTSGAGRSLPRNWVRQENGPSEAAKKLLAGLQLPGASSGRIGALKRITATVNRQHPHMTIPALFEALAEKAHGPSPTKEQIRSYLTRVIRDD